MALEEVESILKDLPPTLRVRAAAVAIDYQATEQEDDLLGLFVGPDFESEEDHGALPPHIILFLESLWDFSEGDEPTFRREVRRTYLHELGHYLGLDEEAVEERDL